jgi:hypothetical protein
MKILIINTHLTYQGWSEGKLNFTFMEIAKTFFVERGDAVAASDHDKSKFLSLSLMLYIT